MSDPKETLRRVEALLDRCERWDRETGMGDLVEQTIHQERAAVVAWLRSESFVMEFRSKRNLGRRLADVAADAIERGEHRREEER